MADEEGLKARIRHRAHQIWLDEGRPAGQHLRHWEMAAELVAIEANKDAALKPVDADAIGPEGEPVEPLIALENEGEAPVLTDQGDKSPKPRSRRGKSKT